MRLPAAVVAGLGLLEVRHQLQRAPRPTPTATSSALLGLLAIRPWPAYELVAQSTAAQARAVAVGGIALGDELLRDGGQFPGRLHLTERVVAFCTEFMMLLNRWCDETLDEVDTWPETKDLGLTPQARQRLTELMAEARELLSG